MKILVTGGAGYIGGFMTKRLLERGDEVHVLDSLERGHKEVIDERATFHEGSLLDSDFLSKVFSEKFDAVIHFAAYISMGESMEKPELYFRNNTLGSLNLVEEMLKSGTNKLIFSSSAGVYGNPEKTPIPEDHPKNPANPYGESKLMTERMLAWFANTRGLSFVALRYFNAAGAALDGSMGEMHSPESHILPNAIKALIKDEEFTIYGNDYKTDDGTCVRDYIHVLDLVDAHVLSLEKLENSKGEHAYNVGTGNGYSNKEIVETLNKVTGKELKVKIGERRAGDADILVADSSKIRSELGFDPKQSDLETIIETAYDWHKSH